MDSRASTVRYDDCFERGWLPVSGRRGRALAMVAVLLVSTLSFGTAFVGTVAAVDNATISSSPTDSGDVVNHTVTFSPDGTDSAEDGNSIEDIRIDYTAGDDGANVSAVDPEDVHYVKVDSASDDDADYDASYSVKDVSVENGGHTLVIDVGGSKTLTGGQTWSVKYGDVENPSQPGNYTASIDVNYASSSNPVKAIYEVTDDTPPNVGVNLFTTGGNSSQDVDVNVTANEELGSFSVEIGDDHQETLSKSDFTLVQSGDTYVYRANITSGEDGHYTATVTDAVDTEGNAISETPDDELWVDTVPVDVVNGSISPANVTPNSTVDHDLTVSVDDFTMDGGTDTVRVDFANVTDVSLGNVTAANATVTNASLADADEETVAVDLDTGDGGGTTDVTVSLNVTAHYPGTAEGRTLPVDVTALDSDGDEDIESNVTSVTVGDSGLTVSNFTLHTVGGNTSQNVNLSFVTSDQLDSVSVDLTGDAGGSLSLDDLTLVSSSTDAYNYTANVSSGEDGTYHAELASATDTQGDRAYEDDEDTLTVNTVGVDVVNGTITNDTVADDNTTVEHTVTVDVEDYSTDGGTDTLRVGFDESLDVTLGNVTAANASVTNASIVDADGDGTATTAEVDLDTGDGGGLVDVTVSLNVTAHYPLGSEGTTYAVDATALDSDGDEDTETNVTSVHVNDTVPQITNYSVFVVGNDTTSQDVDVAFNVTKELAEATVDLGGSANGTLTLDDLNETRLSDGYRYRGDVSSGEDGHFWANLTHAADADGDTTDDYADNATVNTVPVEVIGGNVTPDPVSANESTTLNVSVQVANFSEDGGTDEVHVHVNDSFAADYTLAGASVENGSATVASATAKQCDGDADNDCTVVSLDTGDDGGTTDVTVSIQLNVTTPDVENATYPFHAHAFDSDGDEDGPEQFTTVTVVDHPPHITNFTLVRVGGPNAQDVDLVVNATEALSPLEVNLSGAETGTLTRNDFTETDAGEHVYRANVSEHEEGKFVADLDVAAAPDGDRVPNDHRDSLLVNTVPVDVVNVTSVPSQVVAGQQVTQSVTVDVADFSRDGGTDVVTVRLPDATGGTVTVQNATVVATNASANNSTTLWTAAPNATVVEGSDADTAVDTVRVPLETGDGGGLVDVTVSVTASVRYADDAAGETLPVGAAAFDSDGDSDAEPTMADVTVVAPTDGDETETIVEDDTTAPLTNVTSTTNDTTVSPINATTPVNVTPVNLSTPTTPVENRTGAALEAVNVSANFSGEPNVTVSTNATSPTGEPVANESVDALTYFEVGHEVNDSQIRTATLTFAVDADDVTTSDRVGVYRFGDGEWNRLNATYVGQSGGEHHYRVELGHLSTFALAVDDPDSQVQQSQTTTTQSADTTTEEADGTDDTDTTPSTSTEDTPGFGVVSALVAALAAALLARRRD
ncbi:PGF-CTERM sorting domain-containing protein [Halospeciosus flavus]|uniref:PGF-CTERM sorting domain-containing protein n=1 Tax=Halospeciosus flavus TaxID=3032283 RepID=UPI00361A6765